MKKSLSLLLMSLGILLLAACGGDSSGGKQSNGTIVFADAGWDSVRVHNTIAQNILEHGYGYETDVMTGSTLNTFHGLRTGDIDVYMEVWTDNIKEVYEEAIEAGDVIQLAVNFDDNEQGLFVPTYVIKGDSERGIEPIAPDLRTVEDLKNYPELFPDPENKSKGRIINAPSGWAANEFISKKFQAYGLEDTFTDFMPGSDAAIVASLIDAYNKGEAWVGYYWSPTSITAKYDLTLLEEPAYDKATWEETAGTAFPPNDVTVAVNKDLVENAPEVTDFLAKYETSSELTEEALLYMEENDVDHIEAALWWMNEHEDLWTSWVSEDIATKVKEALNK